jgi:mannose-1-phosphate guanylyltransferase
VVVFPSDHFIVEEDLFMAHVAFGFHLVEQNPSRLILLGVKSTEPETEYGYILPDGKRTAGPMTLLGVQRFVEKPEPSVARELVAQGGLWNTFVMIFATKTMLELVRSQAPALYDSFLPIFKTVGTPAQGHATETAYRSMKATNFSKALLEKLALHPNSCLCVLPVAGVFWSDWGSEDRLLNDLKRQVTSRGCKESQRTGC